MLWQLRWEPQPKRFMHTYLYPWSQKSKPGLNSFCNPAVLATAVCHNQAVRFFGTDLAGVKDPIAMGWGICFSYQFELSCSEETTRAKPQSGSLQGMVGCRQARSFQSFRGISGYLWAQVFRNQVPGPNKSNVQQADLKVCPNSWCLAVMVSLNQCTVPACTFLSVEPLWEANGSALMR